MKIGLVTPSWPGGDTANGIATAIAHLASGFEETGHQVTIIPLRSTGGADRRVIDLPAPRPWTLLEKLSGRLGRQVHAERITPEQIVHAVREAITRNGIEILVMEETQGWAEAVQQAVDIPVVVTLHGPWFVTGPLSRQGGPSPADRNREKREGIALAACAGITAPSRDVLEKTVALYGLAGLPSAVIRNPMPVGPKVDYDALNEKERQSLLFVGRFDHLKGGDVLLAAFRQLIDQRLDIQLTIAGPDRGLMLKDGSRQPIAEAIASLPQQARARIDYLGPLAKAEIAKLRTRHAIAVVASRYENLSYAMLESLAAGAATICTAVGGHTETIRDGETGLLVPPGDPTALATACRRLIEDPGLATRLGTAAHREISNVFSPARIAEEMSDFLGPVHARWCRKTISSET